MKVMQSSLQKLLLFFTTQSKSSGFDYCPLDFVDQENGSVEISGQWRRKIADV